jgi:hypothetical protein
LDIAAADGCFGLRSVSATLATWKRGAPAFERAEGGTLRKAGLNQLRGSLLDRMSTVAEVSAAFHRLSLAEKKELLAGWQAALGMRPESDLRRKRVPLKLFRSTSRLELYGDSLRPREAWAVDGLDDPSAFLRALPDLLPDGTVLFLESVGSEDGMKLTRKHRLEPEPDWQVLGAENNFFHLPLNRAVADELADFLEDRDILELASDLHAYRGERVLLEWHDAFQQPLRLSRLIPEAKVRQFCERLHGTYQRERP